MFGRTSDGTAAAISIRTFLGDTSLASGVMVLPGDFVGVFQGIERPAFRAGLHASR